jgi:hypothetical protein
MSAKGDDKAQRRRPLELGVPELGHLDQHRKIEPKLPHEARAADAQREERREPRPRRAQPGATRGDEHREEDGQADEGRAELGEKSDAERRAQQHPPSACRLAAEPDQRVERDGPGELVEHHRLKEIGRAPG